MAVAEDISQEIAEQLKAIELDFSPVLKGVREDLAKLSESIDMRFNLVEKAWEMKPKAEETDEDKATLQESIVGKMKKSTNMIVPVALGGFGAILVTEVVDGLPIFKSQMQRGIAKGVGAFVFYTWGKKIPFMGEIGKNVMAALLLFDALRDITPISSWASQLATKITKAIPSGGLQRNPNALNQAIAVSQRYQHSSATQQSSATAAMGRK